MTTLFKKTITETTTIEIDDETFKSIIGAVQSHPDAVAAGVKVGLDLASNIARVASEQKD